MQRLPVLLTLACVLCGCAAQPPEPNSFESAEAFQTALAEAIDGGRLDAFWDAAVAGRPAPLVFGETAVFIYRGEAESVRWSADYAISDGSLKDMRGERQGDSDVWLHERDFPADARLSYRIILDDEAMLDPLNPYEAREGSGPVSELRMPAYEFPEAAVRRDDVARGALSDNITFHSEHLPYPVNYRVYTPSGYESLDALPVIYVADGQEYLDDELGSMVIILDNLIAEGAIEPVMAVFLDPHDVDTGRNRRDSQYLGSRTFDAYLVEELVPTIDADYRTAASADRRAILGESYGGTLAAHMGLEYSDTFGLIGMHSPVFPENASISGYAELEHPPLKVFMSVGTLGDVDLSVRREVRDMLVEEGYPLRYVEVNDGHAWGNYRRMTDDTLIYFFGEG